MRGRRVDVAHLSPDTKFATAPALPRQNDGKEEKDNGWHASNNANCDPDAVSIAAGEGSDGDTVGRRGGWG